MIRREYGVSFNGIHSWRDLHLSMEERQKISEAKPDLLLYKVPGRNGVLDASESRTGYVTYFSRTLTCDFYLREGAGDWAYRYSEMQRLLHGKQMRIVFDDDRSYYYFGRVEVDELRSSRYLGRISVKAEVDPYKYEVCSSLEPWLWDPFNFRHGVIRNYGRLTPGGALDAANSIAVDGSKTLTVKGTPLPVVPAFYAKSSDGNGISVTYKGVTYALYLTDSTHTVAGHNVIEGVTQQAYIAEGLEYDHTTGAIRIPDIELAEGTHILTFTGHGAVAVGYRGGRL